VIVGTDNGIVKVVELENNKVVSTWGVQEKDREIDFLGWANTDITEFALAMKNGKIQFFNTLSGLDTQYDYSLKGDRIKGMHVFTNICTEDGRKFITCSESGKILINKNNDILDNFNVKAPIYRMKVEKKEQNLMAIGGKENDIQLYDISQKKSIWSAKNVGQDKLDMRVPIWITDIQFFNTNINKVVCSTAYKEIRVYDIKAQRRPVINSVVSTNCINTISLCADETTLLAGDVIGTLYKIDLRNGKMHSTFSSICGSIRSIDTHISLPYVATGGLDRFLRVHNVNTRKLAHKIYIKQRINFVLYCKDGIAINEEEKKEHETVEEMEDENNSNINESEPEGEGEDSEDSDDSDDSDVDEIIESLPKVGQKRHIKTKDNETNESKSRKIETTTHKKNNKITWNKEKGKIPLKNVNKTNIIKRKKY